MALPIRWQLINPKVPHFRTSGWFELSKNPFLPHPNASPAILNLCSKTMLAHGPASRARSSKRGQIMLCFSLQSPRAIKAKLKLLKLFQNSSADHPNHRCDRRSRNSLLIHLNGSGSLNLSHPPNQTLLSLLVQGYHHVRRPGHRCPCQFMASMKRC